MPTAKTHKTITIISQFATLPAVFLPVVRQDFVFWAVFQVGIFVAYYVTPDADIAQKLGPIGKMLGLEDYESEMGHRGGMSRSHWRESWVKALLGSHIPLIGTFMRLLPILVLLCLASFLVFGRIYSLLLAAFLLGAAWSDLWHVVADLVTTKWKRWIGGKKREFRI